MTLPPPPRGKCVEPGHWVIGGRRVRAVYQGRSSSIMGWKVEPAYDDTEVPPDRFIFLNDVREWIRDQEQETVMSSTISIELDPETEGVRYPAWDTWARDHGLVQNPGNGMFYAGDGSARVEIGYSTHRITFSTYHMGPGLPAVAELALELWAATGGGMHASPELSQIIALRYAGAGVLMEVAGKLQRETS